MMVILETIVVSMLLAVVKTTHVLATEIVSLAVVCVASDMRDHTAKRNSVHQIIATELEIV